MKQIVQSWLRLPLWVNIWVWFFLVPANAAAFFFLETATGFYGALAAGFVAVVNSFLIFANKGPSKVLAIPHLIAWVPLVGYIGFRAMFGEGYSLSSPEGMLALIMGGANLISLGFDVYDTREWMNGKRGVAGFPDAPVRF